MVTYETISLHIVATYDISSAKEVQTLSASYITRKEILLIPPLGFQRLSLLNPAQLNYVCIPRRSSNGLRCQQRSCQDQERKPTSGNVSGEISS
jgi:hypothetical protein